MDPAGAEAAVREPSVARQFKVTGAEWIHPGWNHVEARACTCESTRFNVHYFCRVWYPDLGRLRLEVLETNGNDLTHFGRYANADTVGAIPCSWLTGVSVSERHVYTSDELSRRLLRLRITCAAEATCEAD